MPNIDLQPTSTAHWHALVCEGEKLAARTLREDVQSYLVFLLQRFLGKTEIAAQVLALDYLKGLRTAGQRQFEKLRDVGDVCLLHAGLFPQRARRRRVSVNYYVDLGIGAYYQLHQNTQHAHGALFAHLCEGFVAAMDVLQAIHGISNQPLLDAISAHELWEHTGSTQARKVLEETSRGNIMLSPSQHRH